MRSRRLPLAVTALMAVTALGACSDGDSDGGDQPKSAESPSAPSESPTLVKFDQCRVDVRIAGAVETAWKGRGTTGNNDGATLYQSSDGKKGWISLIVRDGSADRLVVTVDGADHIVKNKLVKLETTDGKVKATARFKVASGEVADLTASFAC